MNVIDAIQLLRSGDRRTYAFDDIGTLCVTGWSSRAAIADAGGQHWEITYRGIWQPVIQAADAAGDVVGTFKGRTLRRRSSLAWSHHEFTLRPDRRRPVRYHLINGNRELAVIEGRSWDEQPMVNVNVDERGDIDAGLLLFAAFVVGKLAQHAT